MRVRIASRRIAAIAAGTMLVIALAAIALPRTASPGAAAGDCTIDASLDADEKAFLGLINAYRVQNSLPPLKISYALTRASAWKSKDLGVNNYFAHDDLTRTWVQRIRDCNYGYNTYLGENIAAGVTTAQQAFDIWRNSPGHNANMLGTNYNSIGIGRYYVAGSTYGWYWTTDFGGYDDGWSSISEPSPPAAIGTPTPIVTPPAPHGNRHRRLPFAHAR